MIIEILNTTNFYIFALAKSSSRMLSEFTKNLFLWQSYNLNRIWYLNYGIKILVRQLFHKTPRKRYLRYNYLDIILQELVKKNEKVKINITAAVQIWHYLVIGAMLLNQLHQKLCFTRWYMTLNFLSIRCSFLKFCFKKYK